MSERGFEVGTRAALKAVHREPWKDGPEGEAHAHDYRIELGVESPTLDERGMVCDLDLLDGALLKVLERLDGQDLDAVIHDADAVTVEVLSRWLHGELRVLLADAGVEWLAVRVWESPEAFGGYRGPVDPA